MHLRCSPFQHDQGTPLGLREVVGPILAPGHDAVANRNDVVRPGLDERLLIADIEGAVVAPFRVDLSLDTAFFTGALPGL
ncbi:hypothetical protein MYX64_06350 [Nitrospinae bacterium AH_259_B05_G02_I21]|nr:hypothetical protein [Nitrospinae bacterium AH_259_B05_G02_I21]